MSFLKKLFGIYRFAKKGNSSDWISIKEQAEEQKDQNNFDNAWKYYNEAIHVAVTTKVDFDDYIMIYFGMADLLTKEGKYKQALAFYAYVFANKFKRDKVMAPVFSELFDDCIDNLACGDKVWAEDIFKVVRKTSDMREIQKLLNNLFMGTGKEVSSKNRKRKRKISLGQQYKLLSNEYDGLLSSENHSDAHCKKTTATGNRLRKLEKSFTERVHKGKEHENRGNIGKAISIYEELVLDEADIPFAYERLAIIYRKQKNYSDEIRVLNCGVIHAKNGAKFRQRIIKAQKLLNK